MNRLMQWLIVLAVSVGATKVFGATECQDIARPISGNAYEVSVDTTRTVRKLQPEFFGFNLEWVEFQLSLWDSANRRVNPDVVQWLKAFPGAVYRYPGGTVANFFDWKGATGDISRRKPQQAVSWRDPLVAEFGLVEYLNFVQSVRGRPWYVLNLYGSMASERSPSEMAKGAGQIAAFFRRENAAGLPALFRWELGNELDRDRFLWRPEKYAEVAGEVLTELSIADKTAQAVALSQDWNASKEKYGIDATAYNTYMGKTLQGKVTEFASHYYYDGLPWGPPVPNQLRQHCLSVRDIGQSWPRSPDIWVTEHGRTPEGTPADKDWKRNWPQTANLSAAISVADMLITLSQEPSVKGAFLHALHATDGPWPLFHRQKGGAIVPSTVYWGMRMLRESMLPEVLRSQSKSANISGYEGGYDMRAVVMTDASRKHYAVWAVNRDGHAVDATLSIPSLKGNVLAGKQVSLSDENTKSNNYLDGRLVQPVENPIVLVFDASGTARVVLPSYSVTTISVELHN